MELLRAGALPSAGWELLGEGCARGLPEGESVPVYRGPDSVAAGVYTPVGEFWIRWAPVGTEAGVNHAAGSAGGAP
ncbi:MAG: hypothetical protein H5T97_12455 [Firmicutes bacterium]|nr:hypothetical protein [Bacillota bacterium]